MGTKDAQPRDSQDLLFPPVDDTAVDDEAGASLSLVLDHPTVPSTLGAEETLTPAPPAPPAPAVEGSNAEPVIPVESLPVPTTSHAAPMVPGSVGGEGKHKGKSPTDEAIKFTPVTAAGMAAFFQP